MSALGHVLYRQGQQEEAEHLHRRALQIRTHALGADHPHVANSMRNLGLVLTGQGQYEEAEARFLLARALWSDRGAAPPRPPLSRSRPATAMSGPARARPTSSPRSRRG